jgi:hypothetical protein
MWKVFKPVCEHVIFPLCDAIWKVVKVVFQAIGAVLGVLVNVPPIFLGIGFLLTVIGVYKGGGAFIRCAREFFSKAPAQIPA